MRDDADHACDDIPVWFDARSTAGGAVCAMGQAS